MSHMLEVRAVLTRQQEESSTVLNKEDAPFRGRSCPKLVLMDQRRTAFALCSHFAMAHCYSRDAVDT